MPIVNLDSLDDPRIAAYRNLKDRDLAQRYGRFIAEGQSVVRRLLQSDYETESILLAERYLADAAAVAPPDVVIYAAPQQLLDQIIGYHFHTGMLACGKRKPPPSLSDIVPPAGDVLIVVCPDLNNSENLGGMIRLAAGFGATAMLLGERSCDPFFRQTVRVSMGTIFSMPIVQSTSIVDDLKRLGALQVQRIATVLHPQAESLAAARKTSKRIALLFGNEAYGLSPEHVGVCDRKITIPMKLGTDSLNVAVTAGIILHHFVYVALPG